MKCRLVHGFYLPWLWFASIILSGSGVPWLAGCGSARSAGTLSAPTRCPGRSSPGSSQHPNTRVEHVPATALLGDCCCQTFPFCVLSRHHKLCIAVANWAFGRILYNWVSVWIIHTYALLKLEKFRVFLCIFSVASWSDWVLMSLCIFSQHKLFLNSFLNILLTATNLAKIVNLFRQDSYWS